MTPLLSISGLTAWYGAAQALFGVDLKLHAGEVVALMGRNGMGKTTTVKVICGMLPPGGGELAFAGSDIARLPAHKVAQRGVGLVPEGRRCFAGLTVLENLTAAARPGNWTFAEVGRLFPRLLERRGQMAQTLSGGEQQMLAIGRALMTNPKLLVLDEATEGLAPVIRQEIWAALNKLKSEGMSILVIDKSLKELSAIADHCVILERGATCWTGAANKLTPEIADRYLGV